MKLGRKRIPGRHREEREEAVELVRLLGHELGVPGEYLRGLLERPEHRAGDHRADRAEPERERRHDAEVPAPAAKRPEEIVVLVLGGSDDRTVGEDDLGLEQVVDREPQRPCQMTDPTTEREAPDARGGDDPEWRREPVLVRRGVHLAEEGAAEDAGRTRIGVDVDPAHRREVDDEPIVDAAEPGSVVPAAAHGDFQPLLATEEDSCSDIGRVHRVCDHERAAIDHRVVERSSLVVARVTAIDHLAS